MLCLNEWIERRGALIKDWIYLYAGSVLCDAGHRHIAVFCVVLCVQMLDVTRRDVLICRRDGARREPMCGLTRVSVQGVFCGCGGPGERVPRGLYVSVVGQQRSRTGAAKSLFHHERTVAQQMGVATDSTQR